MIHILRPSSSLTLGDCRLSKNYQQTMKDENESPFDDIATIRLSRTNSADHSDGIGQALIDLYDHLDAKRRISGCPHAITLQTTGSEGIR